MTKQEMLLAMQQETNFKKMGILLELYALEALDNNEFSIYDPAMVLLKNMLCEHIIRDYYSDSGGRGDPWYIRSGNKALLTYVYCSLKEWFPEPDIANVLRVGEKMHHSFFNVEKSCGDLDEQKIKDIMTVLDEKFSYSRVVFGEIIPVFLIMDVAPYDQDKHSFRTGCELTYNGFILWRRRGSVLPVPNETSFLLNLSDTLLLKAWIQDEDLVRSRIRTKLAELGFDWVLQESERRLLRHVGDLACIGLTCDTPLFKYVPFSDQTIEYRSYCRELVKDLIEIASAGNHPHSRTFH